MGIQIQKTTRRGHNRMKKENNQKIRINIIDYDGDDEKLKQHLEKTLQQYNKESPETEEDINKTINRILKATTIKEDDDNEIPTEAYDEDGELKESYRKAYHTILEETHENHKETQNTPVKPEPLEFIDSTTADIKHIIDNLIDNTGIIETCTITFKKGLTQTILQTLSQYKYTLTETSLDWRIEQENTDYIKLTLNNK